MYMEDEGGKRWLFEALCTPHYAICLPTLGTTTIRYLGSVPYLSDPRMDNNDTEANYAFRAFCHSCVIVWIYFLIFPLSQ